MSRSEGEKGSGFHELPLVLFTALTIAGAGIGVAHLGFSVLGWAPWIPPRWVRVAMGGLFAGGLLFSVGHLGKPLRGSLALARFGKSPLSNEIVGVGVALGGSLLALFLPSDHTFLGPASIVAMVSSVLVLLALGHVYRLGGQHAWMGPVLVHPLVLGLGLGSVALLGALPAGVQVRGELLILSLLFLDGLLVWERTGRLSASLRKGTPVQPGFMRLRWAALSLRVMLGVLVPAGALLWGEAGLALVSLSLNLLLDRLLFYGLAVRETTRSGILKVDEALRAHAGLYHPGHEPAPDPMQPVEE